MEETMIDFKSPFGKRAASRLAKEEIIWLTTTDSRGSPQPRPVWFLWNEESILIFSEPEAHKVRHIRNHPWVSLNLDSSDSGEDIVVILGEATILNSKVPEFEMDQYLKKYRRGLKQINMTEDEFNNSYDLVIRIKPQKLRGI
jgi:PPOX class probable F420-dependent enzyme